MRMFSVIVLVIWAGFVSSSVLKPTISLIKPQGIRFSVPDASGLSLVAFHYSINKPVPGVLAGQYNVDVTSKTGNEWVHENPTVQVQPGDTVNYWTLQIIDGIGNQLLDQSWTASVQTTTTTTTTTTTRPTTRSIPDVTTAVPANTPTPIVSNNNNQQPSGSTSGTTLQNGPQPPTTTGSSTSQSGSTSGTTSGSCDCTGSSIKPPGSEKTCTTFPCLIFEDEFDKLDLDVWEHEITLGGGGNWEFNFYTNNRSNSYVRDGNLYIKPTLTVDSLAAGPDALSRSTLDVWGSQPGDVCTGNAFYGCQRSGTPENIINPIQSARLRSSRGFNFKYGKVEVRAKMPTGDWLWPAIWMLPLRNAYGKWPTSGEIDIVEARGNVQYTDDRGNPQGIENAGSTLHFGSDVWHNKWHTAHGEKLASSGTYGDSFHKYILVWDEDHISISIDDTEVLNVTPQTTMWEYGGNDQDGVENPWAAGTKMAPFDQEFFLIMNVAVGGTAFFPDRFVSPSGKPWSDKSAFATRDFWNGRNQWLPTWNLDKNNGEDAAMVVDYVKVWKLKP